MKCLREFVLIASVVAASSAGADPRLAGTWIKACGPAIGGEHYDRVTLDFVGNQMRTSIENFTDAACLTPFAPSPNPTAQGIVNLGIDIDATDGTRVIEMDTQITRFNGAPFDIRDYSIIRFIDGGFYSGVETEEQSSPVNRTRTLDMTRLFVRQ